MNMHHQCFSLHWTHSKGLLAQNSCSTLSSYREKDMTLIRIANCWWNNPHSVADVHPIATMGSVQHMSLLVGPSWMVILSTPPRSLFAQWQTEIVVLRGGPCHCLVEKCIRDRTVWTFRSVASSALCRIWQSVVNGNLSSFGSEPNRLSGIPTYTGHFRCSKPFCTLLYRTSSFMLNRHKFQPGAKLLVNHLVDQSLGLGVKFFPTSSAHHARGNWWGIYGPFAS